MWHFFSLHLPCMSCIILSPGVLYCLEFHWFCLFFSVGTDNEPGSHAIEGTLQEPGTVGSEEQNEDAETDSDCEASDTNEEHGLGVNGQSSLKALAHARFICIMLFDIFLYYAFLLYFIFLSSYLHYILN